MPHVTNVAIIGGGLAGLAAARLLALRGVAATVHEANGKPGGCCATTRIDGYTFNDGALFVAMPTLLDALFRRLELDRAALVPLQAIENVQRTVLPDGTVVTFGRGDLAIDGDAAGTARARAQLQGFLSRWDPLLRVLADDVLVRPLSLPRFAARAWRHLGLLRGTAAARLDDAFSAEPVRGALSAALLYIGVPALEAPAVSVLGLAALFRDGYFIPEGGMGRIPDALAAAVIEKGGDIRLGSRVTRIVVDRGRVRGVEIDGAGRIQADAVISTVSGMRTLRLLSAGDAPSRMARKARRAVLSHRGFALQLGLSNRIDVTHYANYAVPFLRDQRDAFVPHRDRLRWPSYMVPTLVAPGLAPPGASIVEMFPPISQDLDPAEWTADRQEEVALRAIERLRELHRVEVAVRRIVSPREYERDLHLQAGALYGLSPTGGPGSLFSHRTPIRGLYQAGQTSWPGFGVAPAAWSGVMAAEASMRDGA